MITQRVSILLSSGCLAALAGCAFSSGGFERDFRSEGRDPVLFDPSAENLPGVSIVEARDVDGIRGFNKLERWAKDGTGNSLFHYALYLKLDGRNTYELTYQAYWSTRNLSDPAMPAVDVRERGSFVVGGNSLMLYPEETKFTEKLGREVSQRTIPNEDREYAATLDGPHLHVAGPCASYQVEPICQYNLDVWYPLRSSRVEWPLPPLF